jgi:Holliday junction resolvase RusA-like endonuclease
MTMGAVPYPKNPSSEAVHIEKITLDLPVPPSVNALRRVDWAGNRKRKTHYLRTDLYLTAYGPKPAPVRLIRGAYELQILVPETRCDIDNLIKCIVDYLVSREFTPDDSNLRELSIKRAAVSACRVTITELT